MQKFIVIFLFHCSPISLIEQFKNGISSLAENSYKTSLYSSIFTIDELKKYEQNAKQFKKDRLGDQTVFL